MLKKKDCIKVNKSSWETLWVPAILQYCSSLGGKTNTLLNTVKEKYNGTFIIL